MRKTVSRSDTCSRGGLTTDPPDRAVPRSMQVRFVSGHNHADVIAAGVLRFADVHRAVDVVEHASEPIHRLRPLGVRRVGVAENRRLLDHLRQH